MPFKRKVSSFRRRPFVRRRFPVRRFRRATGRTLRRSTGGTNPWSIRGCDNRTWGICKGIGAPRTMDIHLAFDETWLETNAAGFAYYSWRGNSIYDPDQALLGASAAGTLAWKNLYTQYKVISSQIQIEACNNDADDPLSIVVYADRGLSSAPTYAYRDSFRGFPGARNTKVLNQTGRRVLTHFARSKDVFGVSQLDDDGFIAQMGANPAHMWYWNTLLWNESGNALHAECRVRIVFHVLLLDPNMFNFQQSAV